MKKIFKLTFVSMLALSLHSCSKWLDINVNPDSPTNVVASPALRLPWIQQNYGYAYASAAQTISPAIGTLAYVGANAYMKYDPPTGGGPNTPYQRWFVGGAVNIPDLVTIAEAEGAYHYVGAAYVLEAMGYVLMADLYGEMPYSEAVGSSLSPKYDDGKTIYTKALARLDEALVLFAKTQTPGASALKDGDDWNNGDVNKWIKLTYGLKARWLNNLSKKSTYDPAAILAALELGPKSYEESTIVHHVNDPADMGSNSDPFVGDPLKTCYLFNMTAWGTTGRMAKWYMDLLVGDPRLDKLAPATQRWKNGAKYWARTQGVDLINDKTLLTGSGPLALTYNASETESVSLGGGKYTINPKGWYVNNSTPERQNDTLYLQLNSNAAAISGAGWDGSSIRYQKDGTAISTGTFYTRPESPTAIMTDYEMLFIKAEVLLRKGDGGGALSAYKAAVKAHVNSMNAKLKTYVVKDGNIDKMPIDQAAVDVFFAKIDAKSSVTMADVMTQKYIAMTLTVQNWNDMRRFNYSAPGSFGVVYPGFDRSVYFSSSSMQFFPGTSKTDMNYWFRRFKNVGHEINYNSANLEASNPKAMTPLIWSDPVWWDIAE